MKTHILASLIASLLFGAISSVHAFPDVERTPGTSDAPLSFSSLTSDPSFLAMPPEGSDFEDRFLIVGAGTKVFIIDTETWELYGTQPDDFEETIEGLAFLPNSNSLFISLNDSTIARIELDDLAADPQTSDVSTVVSDAVLGPMVIDQDQGDDQIYLLDISNKKLHIFDISERTIQSSILLRDTTTNTTYTPTDIAFANLTSGTDKIYISTSDSAILVFQEGSTTFSVLTPDADTHNFAALTPTPNGSALLCLDTTTNSVWVIDTSDNTFQDQQTGDSETTPITIVADGDEIENNSLSDLIATDVETPTDTYAYIAGDLGLSVADVSAPTSAIAASKLIDLNPASTEDANDPLTLGNDPISLAASSADDGYVYVGTTDDTIAVVSDNPFVTISADSVSGSLTPTATTFALTFQSDEAGSYRVVLNSDVSASTGTELIASTSFTDVDTNITTATIDINNFSAFNEGTNRIFVFVTDADGNVGRDAIDVTVDLPPDTVTITGLDFGTAKIYATFTPLSVSDIDYYLVLAEAATGTDCPDTLDFEALDATTADGSTTVSGDDCDSSDGSCTATISGLTNDVPYCIGIRAIDDGGQESATTGVFSQTQSPRQTTSITGLADSGCTLASYTPRPIPFILWMAIAMGLSMLVKFCLLIEKRVDTRKKVL